MNKLNKVLMKKHGITTVTRTTYNYKDYHYASLQDAIKYADYENKIISSRKLESWSEI